MVDQVVGLLGLVNNWRDEEEREQKTGHSVELRIWNVANTVFVKRLVLT